MARLYPVFWEGFNIDAGGVNPMALIGGITILIAAVLAFVQVDIKKVLAYSTVSQLGYMVMGLGVGAWTAAVFHLFTHAFFKALLFLGAGSVSHSGSHHSFDMKKDMGGLRKYMPITFWTFIIGTLALIGRLPAGRLLVEGRDHRQRRAQRLHDVHGRRPHRRRPDRGLHDPLRLPHLLRRVPRRPPRAPTSTEFGYEPAGDDVDTEVAELQASARSRLGGHGGRSSHDADAGHERPRRPRRPRCGPTAPTTTTTPSRTSRRSCSPSR